MQIERSSVRIRQSAEEKSPEVVLHDVEATVRVVASHCRLSSQVDSHQDIVHQFEIGASGKSSGLLADLNVQCSLDSTMQLIEILGDATGLHFSQRLLDLLQPISQRSSRNYRDWSARPPAVIFIFYVVWDEIRVLLSGRYFGRTTQRLKIALSIGTHQRWLFCKIHCCSFAIRVLEAEGLLCASTLISWVWVWKAPWSFRHRSKTWTWISDCTLRYPIRCSSSGIVCN